MIRALNTAATGMKAQEESVNTISNNIANVNTTGFKKTRTEFEDLLYETVKEAGGRTGSETFHAIGQQIGSGAKVSGTRKEHTQGSPKVTDGPYDLMINGDGFFGIIGPDNNLKYTRDGSFSVDVEGNLVTKHGHKVFPGIVIPPSTIKLNIAQNGQVDAYLKGQVEPQNLGVISVFTFVNPTGLKSVGGNLMDLTAGSGQATQMVPGENQAGVMEQGMLEQSNVNVMNEMTELMKAQRSYEMNSKVMGIADQMLSTINNIR